MARSRYEFIKIEQRLFNDPNFYMLTEFEQLTYIKLVSMLKQTRNKIPKNLAAIQLYLRTNRSLTEVESAVNRIKSGFKNFKENKYFYYFQGFNKMYGYPGVEEEEDKEEDKDKDTDKENQSQIQELFTQFWLVYPRKVAKQKALIKWISLSKKYGREFISITAPLMFKALEKQKLSKQWVKDSGEFIPHPTTWLNQERWNDEIKEKGDWRDG